MLTRVYYNLKSYDDKPFYLRRIPISIAKRRLEHFLESEPELCTKEHALSTMFSYEIKANNRIEGEGDDLDSIARVIADAESIKDESKKTRILNLYHAYRYILGCRPIDKETLRELYRIISKDALNAYSLEHMGEYYRKDKVYVMDNANFDIQISERASVERIEEFMNLYFDFLNSYEAYSETEEYIKSQIMHFYFVYIHPYFDVNGRTSRTLAMWYLLNKEVYPYIIFNRGIAFQRGKYGATIDKVMKTRDLTYFVSLMLKTVEAELEKEYVIRRIAENAHKPLDAVDKETLQYFLSMKGKRTVRNFTYAYNGRTNRDMKDPSDIYDDMIVPLLEKGILDITTAKKKSQDPLQNEVLTLKPISIDRRKIHNIEIK